MLLTHMADLPAENLVSARSLAECTHVPQPTVSKLLKMLSRAKLLEAQRGKGGGYRLAFAPNAISVAQIIECVEGPVAMTDCSTSDGAGCGIEGTCRVKHNWQKINSVVFDALSALTLADMRKPIEDSLDQYKIQTSHSSLVALGR